MRHLSLLASILLSISLLGAQNYPLGGPIEGYTFDNPTKSFRAVIGSLGSASLGAPVLKGLDYGSVAPRKNYGLAFQGTQCLLVSGLDSGQASSAPLSGVYSVPEGVVWSANGSVAILHSKTNKWIQTIRGLPDSPNAGPRLDLAELGDSPTTVATDFDGEHIAIGAAGDNSGLFQIVADVGFRPLLSLSTPVSLAFSDDGSRLYALGADAGILSELNMADLTSQTWRLSGLENASVIRVARDEMRRSVIYAAGNTDRLLAVYDPSSHERIAQVPLDCEPTVIEPLGLSSFILRPRAADGEPLWSFRNASQPVMYFVPASPLSSEDSGK
jgi:hypothetical protein